MSRNTPIMMGCHLGDLIAPDSPTLHQESWRRSFKAISPITPRTPRTPTRQLFCESPTVPSRPAVTEQRFLVDVISSTPCESSPGLSENDFILVAPRDVASRFVLRPSPWHPYHDQDEVSPSTPTFDSIFNSRGSEVSAVSIKSTPETRKIRKLRHESAHNIADDEGSGCVFIPIQDSEVMTREEEIERDGPRLPQLTLKRRHRQANLTGDEFLW